MNPRDILNFTQRYGKSGWALKEVLLLEETELPSWFIDSQLIFFS